MNERKMDEKKRARKVRLVARLEKERTTLADGSRTNTFMKQLIRRGVPGTDALEVALKRVDERIAEARKGL